MGEIQDMIFIQEWAKDGPPGPFVEVNDAACERLGFTKKELLKLSFFEVFDPQAEGDLFQLREKLSQGKGVCCSLSLKRKRGDRIQGEMTAYLFRVKRTPVILYVFRETREGNDLRRVHDIYRKAIENAQGVPYRFNYADDTYEFIGEGCEALLGVPPENLKVRDSWNNVIETIVTDPAAPQNPREYVSAFQRGETKRYKTDIRLITPKGEEKWLSDYAVPIVDENTGKVVGSLGILQDITDRKRAEEGLRRVHKIYRVAIENARGVPYSLNYKNYTYDFIGEGCEELLGIPAKELTYQKLGQIEKELVVTDPAAPSDPFEYGRAFRRGEVKSFRVDLKLVTRDGRKKWISDCAVPLCDEKTGEVIGSLGILQDITDRKIAEEELKQVHTVYRKTIENARGVPYRLNYKDRKYEFVGEGCMELLGIAPRELSSEALKNLIREIIITDPEAPADPKEYAKEFRKGEVQRYCVDLRIVTPTGEEKWVGDCSVPILDEKTGEVIGALGIMQDITERKWAEKLLKEYAQRLEDMVQARTKELKDIQEQLVRSEKLAILGQLAGGVGHELRRPLGVINNAVYYLKVILTDADDKVREYLNLIAEEIRDAERIVSDLLDFSRIKPADKERVELSRLVEEVLEKTPPPDAIRITTQIHALLPPVIVDPRQISQVLINLIHNAYDAMPEGGHLTIAAFTEESNVHLQVADTGCGISRDNIKKIFEPLYTTKKGGIGLGLSISKNLVEANGGAIVVHSEEGRGSAFSLIFPAQG